MCHFDHAVVYHAPWFETSHVCFSSSSELVFEKAYCEYRLNRVENSLKTIESAPAQTDKLKELYGQVVRLVDLLFKNPSGFI